MKEWVEKTPEEPEKRIGTPTGMWFFAKNIDKAYEELKSKDVEITEPKKQVWGGILCTVYDQDQNSFGLVGDSEENEKQMSYLIAFILIYKKLFYTKIVMKVV